MRTLQEGLKWSQSSECLDNFEEVPTSPGIKTMTLEGILFAAVLPLGDFSQAGCVLPKG